MTRLKGDLFICRKIGVGGVYRRVILRPLAGFVVSPCHHELHCPIDSENSWTARHMNFTLLLLLTII
jgi:hypothetical protein